MTLYFYTSDAKPHRCIETIDELHVGDVCRIVLEKEIAPTKRANSTKLYIFDSQYSLICESNIWDLKCFIEITEDEYNKSLIEKRFDL